MRGQVSKSLGDDELEAELASVIAQYYQDATQRDKLDKLVEAMSAVGDGTAPDLYQIIDEGLDKKKTAQDVADILLKRLKPTALAAANEMLTNFSAGDATFATDGGMDIAFNVIDKNVQQYAYNISSNLIVQIDESMRASIRTMVGDAVSGQYTKQQLAQKIARIIPLHDRYANAVNRLYDTNLRAYLKGGMDPAKAYARAGMEADKYSARLTRLRSRTIARTELMYSGNNGRYIGQSAMIQSGSVRMDVVKQWMTAEDEDVCPVCGPMDGKTVGFYELFSTGQFTPPAHPNCRCTYGIVNKTLSPGATAEQVSYAGFE